MNRRGEKRVGAGGGGGGGKKSLSFTKITREIKRMNNIGELIIFICIWKVDGKGYMCLENQAFSTLNLRQ